MKLTKQTEEASSVRETCREDPACMENNSFVVINLNILSSEDHSNGPFL